MEVREVRIIAYIKHINHFFQCNVTLTFGQRRTFGSAARHNNNRRWPFLLYHFDSIRPVSNVIWVLCDWASPFAVWARIALPCDATRIGISGGVRKVKTPRNGRAVYQVHVCVFGRCGLARRTNRQSRMGRRNGPAGTGRIQVGWHVVLAYRVLA